MVARRLQVTMMALAVAALVGLGLQEALSSDSGATVVAAGAPSTAATVPVAVTEAPTTTTLAPRPTAETVVVDGLAGAGSTAAPGATAPAAGTKSPLDPTWPKQVYVLSDSVLLSGKAALPERFAGWQVTIEGKPAWMVRKAAEELAQEAKPMPPVVVVALGYNSLWEKDRRNYDRWAEKFDREADQMVATLTSLGAKRIVWVTLREPTKDTVPAKAVKELPLYSWYFPWVNERLRALHERQSDVVLADWTAVSNQNGITYDSIHLNATGAKMMADVIATAVGLPPTNS